MNDQEPLIPSSPDIPGHGLSNATRAEVTRVTHAEVSMRNGNTAEDATQPAEFKSYKRRFWIVLVFAIFSCLQCLEWNSWGPISESMGTAFPGWDSGTVAMMGNWGTITFVVFVFPACYLIHAKGLRAGVLAAITLMAAGTLLRCLTLQTPEFTTLCHICAILVGTAGTVVMAAPPQLAAVWFPPKERTSAVAFCQAMNQLGSAISYLQPLIVRSGEDNATPSDIRNDIRRLMILTAGVTCALLAAAVIFFPPRPPSPPSLTSTLARFEFSQAIKSLCRKKQFVYLWFSYSVFLGIPSAWMSVLNFSFVAFGIQQSEAMWVGVSSIVVSCVAALLVGQFTDRFYGHVKNSVICLIVVSCLSFTWFLLLSVQILTPSKWQIYASVVIGVAANFATAPLFFELAVETSYPAPEQVVGGVMTCGNNLVGIIFLLLFFVDTSGYAWVTYCLAAGCLLALVPLLFVKEDYRRSSIDRREHDEESVASLIPTSHSTCSSCDSTPSSSSRVKIL